MRRRWILLATLLCLVPALSRAALPRVARPSLPTKGKSAVDARGLVFFVALKDGSIAAVGTAHTFSLSDVARAGRTDFYLGTSLRRVGSSSRFLVKPGRPFTTAGASKREDFWVYAFDQPPQGVGKLEIDAGPVKVGERVALLGVQERGKRDEDDLFGKVVASSPTQLDVELDLPGSLRGWGGAPILRVSNQKVIGIVEAQISQDGTSRVIAAPIGGVLEALDKPLVASKGIFSQFASAEGAEPPPPAPAIGAAPKRASAHAPVLDQHSDEPTNVHVDIEYPPPGSVVGNSACGVFVAGQAQASRGELRRFDVVIVIDTSRSTIDPAGTDINGNGVVGRQRLGGLGTIFGSGSTDPGDSILAAEVAGAKQLLRGLDPRTTRVGLVVFAGDVPGTSRRSRPAYTMVALTDEYDRVEAGLDEVLATEPEGNTHMAAGVDQATIELSGLRGATSRADANAEKIVFFFTDGQPTLPYGPEAEADNVRAVLRAANRARRAEHPHPLLRGRPGGARGADRDGRDGEPHRRLLHAGAAPGRSRRRRRGREHREPRERRSREPHDEEARALLPRHRRRLVGGLHRSRQRPEPAPRQGRGGRRCRSATATSTCGSSPRASRRRCRRSSPRAATTCSRSACAT